MNRIEIARHVGFVVVVVALFGASSGCARRGSGDSAAVATTAAAMKRKVTRSELADHRARQIERLRAYAEAGVFPKNPSPLPAPVHMFRDAEGHLCAVANLVHLDGLDA